MHPTHRKPAEVRVTPAETLRDAALYLHRHGWHQDDLYAQPGVLTPAACADGAIRCALFGAPLTAIYADQHRQLTRVLGVLAAHIHQFVYDNTERPVDPPHVIVGDWNDEPERTADDVIATMRAAADDWDRIHGGAR
jgi:hypothetical protein